MTDKRENAEDAKKTHVGGGVADFMRRRKISRMLAMQYLFMADMQNRWGELPWNEVGAFRYLAEDVCLSDDADDNQISQDDLDASWPFANILIGGAVPIREELDALICGAVANWNFSRISYIDRAILRLCTFEILKQPKNVTPATAINEAVELAKKFSTREAHKFVNGVLDKVRHLVENMPKAERQENADESDISVEDEK